MINHAFKEQLATLNNFTTVSGLKNDSMDLHIFKCDSLWCHTKTNNLKVSDAHSEQLTLDLLLLNQDYKKSEDFGNELNQTMSMTLDSDPIYSINRDCLSLYLSIFTTDLSWNTVSSSWFPGTSQFSKFYPGHSGNKAKKRSSCDYQEFLQNGKSSYKFDKNEIINLATDYQTCKILQSYLDKLNRHEIDVIYKIIEKDIIGLILNSYGNYFIQKLIISVSLENRVNLLKTIAGQFNSIATDIHGTRVIQSLVDCVETIQEQEQIIKLIDNDLIQFCHDPNSNHIIQKILAKFDPEALIGIYQIMLQNCISISKDKFGCCIIQRCIDYGTSNQVATLIGHIVKNAESLSFDAYGNYVIQYIIKMEQNIYSCKYTFDILNNLKGKLTTISNHKFSSNIIELLLKNPNVADVIIKEFLSYGAKGNTFNSINVLLNDKYGNYVLQTALASSRQNNILLYNQLVNKILPLLTDEVKDTPHGKKISKKIKMNNNLRLRK
ncbi:hypothetical protein KAFR_0A06450 [Kazachstania africana CBS 2517]|uniref:PUM-HD domain-containing protein n=1 Tax=Kazachstania africana (strain ATCC 22294 / BCRC 22015 / CBS 2517 / CECT 1963 / NBRC 1671 / NRRL Y-8276) TaxID=1071382 RepID=H2ANY0_KAZAF|nr:hypothetical protein KAFR_0A06450 [Kazachstania africana CBS 2517]CCF56080.1 hypothetical protein KAFR_0A06450 [Kazachstania africana CBS 2517]